MTTNQKQETRVSGEIETPVLSIDESLTTEERLTDNVVNNILPARYLVDGESPDDMFRRVADNVAKAEEGEANFEEWREEFYDLMSSLSFMPNCVSPDTMVGTPSGNEQITSVEEGDTISDDVGTASVAETFDNGTKQMQTIRTEDGYCVTSSNEHVFRIINDDGEYVWEQARNISPGTVMALKSDYITETKYKSLDTDIVKGEKNNHSPTLPEKMSDDLAKWLGFVIGDGTVRDSGVRVAFDEKDDSDVVFAKLTESLFNIPTNIRERSNASCNIVSVNSVELVNYIRQNEMTKPSSKSAYFPDAVKSSGRSAVTSFLSGLYDSDGSVEERSISYYTSSRELAESVQRILLGVGIVSKLSEKRDGYRVSIRKNKHGQRFVERIGFVSTRKSEAVQRFIGVSSNATTTKIPNQQERLKEWYHTTEKATYELYDKLSQFVIDSDSSHSQDISIEAYEQLAEEYPIIEDSPVSDIVENNLVFKKVESIVDAGVIRATDLNAPERNTFIANGFVSHNSPTLMNAGDSLQQLSACFVVEVGDSMAEEDEFGRASILESAKQAGQIFKCLTEDSRVYIEGRGYVPISSVETGDSVIQQSGYESVSEIHEYADADVMTVTLENGIELTGTPNHKLFSNGEEQRIDEINNGDTIDLSLDWIADDTNPTKLEKVSETLWETNENPELHNAILSGVEDGKSDYEIAESVPESPSTVQRHRKRDGFNSVTQPEVLTEEIAWMVGLWVGDGSYHEDGIRFHNAENHIVNKISEISEQLFDLETSTSHDGSCYEVGLYSSAIKRYWNKNFGDGKPDGSHSASVPECIFRSNRSIVISFVRGLYDADGTIMRNRYPSLTTVSDELSKDVQQLLHGIGIPSTIWTGEDKYQVRPNKDGIGRFLDVIGANESYEVGDISGDTSPVTTYSSPVSSITDSGRSTVYDITVDGNHEYVASSVRSHNSGGGVGYTFGFLRPKGTHIKSTDSKTSGPLQFMNLFDEVCNTVKQGGCIAADTRVMTDEGYKSINSVHNAPPMRDDHGSNKLVRSRDGEYHNVVESSDSGPMDVVTLKTEMGYELVGTPNHPILVVRDGEQQFVQLGNITKEDTIVLDKSDKRFEKRASLSESANYPETMTDDLAKFLGLLWADGTFDASNNRVVFTLGKEGNADQNSIEFIKEFGESALEENVIISDEEKRNKGKCWRVVINSVELINWMKKNGFVKYEDYARLPENLYESPAAIDSFLGGLTADAHIHRDANTYEYATSQKSFASEIQDLLLLCGIPSSISKVEPRENRFSDNARYAIRVTPGQGAALFNDSIPHFLDNLNAEIGDGTPSLERLRDCFSRVNINPDKIEDLSESYLYDSVESIEKSGEEYVYDIEVMDGAHEYVAENFIVHNKRRGAQMAIMPVTHPDIGRFVTAKRVEGDYSNFNISVGVTDKFIEAVQNDDIYELKDPRTELEETFEIVQETKNFFAPSKEDSPEAIVDENIWRDFATDLKAWDWENSESVSFRDKWEAHFIAAEESGNLDVGEKMALPARFIWDMMIDGAWENGEPGLFYLDESNRKHSFDPEKHPEYKINATNPCAEQPLSNYEACNLGHINLSLMVDDDATTYQSWRDKQDFDYHNEKSAVVDYVNESLDFEELDRTIESGTRFLDNVVDMSEFPLDEIDETVNDMRKIGLGVMGWAQMLYQLGIPYGSEESYAAAEHIMSYIDAKGTQYSHKLAKERGTFGAWEDSKYADPMEYPDWVESHAYISPENHKDGYKMRNHNITTVAPTGTTSMIGDTSGGIEPVFSVAYQKNVGNDIQGDDMLVEFDSYFLSALEENGVDVDEIKEIAAEQMQNNEWEGVQNLPIPEEMKGVFVTASDLSPEQHGRMQRAFQSGVDSAISKTVNLPKEATRADIHDTYMLALTDDEIGAPIKGLTVYRDQSREEQVKTTQQYSDLEIEKAKEMLEDLGYSVKEEQE